MGFLLLSLCSFLLGLSSVVSASERISHTLIVDNLIANSEQSIQGSFDVKGKTFLNGKVSFCDSLIMGAIELGDIEETDVREEKGLLKIAFPKIGAYDTQKYIGYLTVTFCADCEDINIPSQMFKAKYLIYYSNVNFTIKRIKMSYYTNLGEAFGRIPNAEDDLDDHLAASLDCPVNKQNKWLITDKDSFAIQIPYLTPEKTALNNAIVHYKIQLAGELGEGEDGEKVLDLGEVQVLAPINKK